MYKTVYSGEIKRCPNRTCRAEWFQDCHKGWLPGPTPIEVYAVMRCSCCRDTFMIMQMLNIVHDYKKSLPVREVSKPKITIFSDEDQNIFRQELFRDDNPLYSLYDNHFPGEE